MQKTEIRVTGFGGQGVVMIGYIIGRAWSVHAGGHATMIQSFGPEARGSACSATLVLSPKEVLYPYVRGTDVLVAMSAEGYEKHQSEIRAGGLLVYESDLVRPEAASGRRDLGIPSTRIAESLGRRLVQNTVMLGFFAGVTRLVEIEAMREAVRLSVPAGTDELNLRAFDSGLEFARAHAVTGTPAGARP